MYLDHLPSQNNYFQKYVSGNPHFRTGIRYQMEDYLERFSVMVEELKAHPSVVVTHFNVADPATDRRIANVERFLGHELSADIRTFYKTCDGLQLRWIYKKNKKFRPQEDLPLQARWFSVDEVIVDQSRVDGCVNILPIQWLTGNGEAWKGRVFFDHHTNDRRIRFNGKEYPELDFVKSVRPFDYFDCYWDAAFITIEPQPELLVARGEDYSASYEDSAVVTFKEYMNQVLLKKGWVPGRKPLEDYEPYILK